jgi:hypothetical protein
MIHGIYLKSRPKSKWQLVSVAISAEAANADIEDAIKQAKAEGNDEAQAVAQVFESSFWIPHYLNEVKEQKPLYN